MMSKFAGSNRDQRFLLPPGLRDWIAEDDQAPAGDDQAPAGDDDSAVGVRGAITWQGF